MIRRHQVLRNHPFPLSVPQSALDDLQARLARTRLPDPETVDDASQGPRLATLQGLVERWRGGYDWRRAEALLNGLGSHRTVIDGLGRLRPGRFAGRAGGLDPFIRAGRGAGCRRAGPR
ncbi:epoxide hydrolase N-terminal domain-containing protein [Telluria beijingensis]|uniref:epoxide hydrolase N-terminal domain-containing protein n=1 Tax=Telluria beijingensis TaxID=3068633 RepID=UPI003BF5BC68